MSNTLMRSINHHILQRGSAAGVMHKWETRCDDPRAPATPVRHGASCARGPSTALACASLLPSNTQVVALPHASSTNAKLSSRPGDVNYSARL